MKLPSKTITLLAGAALFVAAFLWLLTTKGPLAPVGVQSARATRADVSPGVFGIGTVEARLAYAVGPTQAGRVLRVLVDQGEEVKAGQLLAEMDPVDMDHRIQASQSTGARSRQAARAAEAQVLEAESRAKLTQLTRDRDQGLFQKRVITEQALDNSTQAAVAAEAALTAARANVMAAKQDVGRTTAELQSVGSVRDNLKLVSPVNGVIVAREIEPGTTALAGQTILRVISSESLWVRARIDQSRAHGITVGQTASIVLRSAPDTAIAGRVARVEMQGDPVTEERVVNVSFDVAPAHLYVGELAEVNIRLPGATGVLSVPGAAIAREGNQTGVWQLVDGRAQFKTVSLGLQGQDGVVQVLSGLVEDEPVIIYSSMQLKKNARVREQMVAPP